MPESCLGAASSSGAQAAASGSSSITMWLFPILLIVIFLVMIVVPNKRREKKFKDMMESLKVGDQIKTIGGFYGRVVSIKEDLVTFECGPDKAKLTISKTAIASVESFDGGAEVNPKS